MNNGTWEAGRNRGIEDAAARLNAMRHNLAMEQQRAIDAERNVVSVGIVCLLIGAIAGFALGLGYMMFVR